MRFYRFTRYQGRIKIEINWKKITRTEYILMFNVKDSNDLESMLNDCIQVTRIGPRHGIGTVNATSQFCWKTLTLQQTGYASVLMNRLPLRDLMLASPLLATGLRIVRKRIQSAANIEQEYIAIGTQQGWWKSITKELGQS
jgi:hypothetical protein